LFSEATAVVFSAKQTRRNELLELSPAKGSKVKRVRLLSIHDNAKVPPTILKQRREGVKPYSKETLLHEYRL
jgi:hypothetical protein